ncbi:MAG: cytochrome b N-terminal domain-containing protein [Planctomycetota bacterium]
MKTLVNIWNWIDDRSGFSDLILPMMKHTVPRDARWWYVFGSATLTAFIIQILTGISLAMVYVPGGDVAYESLKYISEDATLGPVVRGMHYYGATAMVMLAVVHMVQVFLHASYKYPREMNWMSGVVVLFVVLGMAFTGQLLRWDANGVWSVTVAAEMAGRVPFIGPAIAHFILGGETVGGSTLTRFYAIHVFVLPGLIITGVVLHLTLVLRHGISEMPNTEQPVDPETYEDEYEGRLRRTGVPFWPIAAWRDVVFSTIIVGVILGCAVLVGAPSLGPSPDPADIHANPMPDWYFWWYFAVLSMLPPELETYVILGLPVVAFLGMFLLPVFFNRGHRAITKRPWAVAAVIFGFTAFVVLTIYGYLKPWSPDFGVEPLPVAVVDSTDARVVNGALLVHQKGCLYCHEIEGIGGHRGPGLSTIGDRLNREDLVIRINNGGYNMPSFATSMTADELTQVVEFLETRRDHPTTVTPPPQDSE